MRRTSGAEGLDHPGCSTAEVPSAPMTGAKHGGAVGTASTRHPTAQTLVETTVALIEANGPQSVTIDQVLERSGVSSGSLYHHFGDFPSLVDQALVAIFEMLTSAAVVEMRARLDPSGSLEGFRDGMHRVHAMVNTPEGRRNRAIRTWTVAQALVRPSLRELIAERQDAYTASMLPIIEFGQERGWVRTDLDTRSIALLTQAYLFGTSLDDISNEPVDRTAYVEVLDAVILGAIFTEEARAALG